MRFRVLFAGAAITLGSGCDNQLPDGQPPGMANRIVRECPHDWDVVLDSVVQPPAQEAWWTAGIPEYNDCQRFLGLTDPQRYHGTADSGLFAIFARPSLDSLLLRMTVLRESATPGDMLTTAVSAAWIAAEIGYAPLGIAPGPNCLYLYRMRGRWQARMVRVPRYTDPADALEATRKCLDGNADPRTLQGHDLDVQRIAPPGLTMASDYPAVARWGWDGTTGQHYIGIMCGRAWCAAGNTSGFRPAPVHPARAEGGTNAQRHVVEIHGWYDEQYLGYYNDADNTIIPTDLVGTVFPDETISGRDQADYDGTWLRVSRVALAVDSLRFGPSQVAARRALNRQAVDQYKAKFNFDPTRPGGRLNAVFLCRGTARECDLGGVTVDADRCGNAPLWWIRVIGAGDATQRHMCVRYYPSPQDPLNPGTMYQVPSVTRWRWMANDEGLWDPCPTGCCEDLGGRLQ